MRLVAGLLVLTWGACAWASEAPADWSDEQKELFLKKGKIVRERPAGKGVTGTLRVTLSDGVHEHDASVQTIHVYKARVQLRTESEHHFKDSWQFNVAAYRLARMLGLDSVPVTVQRKYKGNSASFTWWVDDVLMDEEKRQKENIEAPDESRFTAQYNVVKVFDQLIHNIDRNAGNLLIDRQWKLWMIDHSRAFRMSEQLRDQRRLPRDDAGMVERLAALEEKQVRRALGAWLTGLEVRGLMKRRDRIVEHYRSLAAMNQPVQQ